MSLQIGIVGLPNVGKSTLFSALTKKEVPTENYPFCTIDPNVGVVAVPDDRLDQLAIISQSKEIIPTTIEFVDIAGLVKNAHKGEGLGNQFLSHIREVDAIAHVLREFTDSNVTHVEGDPDITRDKEIIDLELIMADLETVTKRIDAVKGKAQTGEKEAKIELKVLNKCKDCLDAGNALRSLNLSDEEEKIAAMYRFISHKPILYVINTNEKQKNTPSGTETEHTQTIELAARYEAEIAGLSKNERKELGIETTGLDYFITASYRLLDLITYFTSGPKETRAWTIKRGTKAPQAAGVIHTDFEKGFIRAETIYWKDLVDLGGEVKTKEAGKMRMEGKDYTVQDGDVMHFHFSN